MSDDISDENKMALHSFAARVARRAKVSSVEADNYIHQFANSISEELEKGGEIHLYHFGRFHTTHIDEQPGHDPNTGAPLTIPEHSRVHFRPYNALRFAVNAPFRHLRIKDLTQDKTAWRVRTAVWILLALVLLLLIVFGLRSKSWISTQDMSLVPPVISSDKPVVAQSNQAPDTVDAASVEPETTPARIAIADDPVETQNNLTTEVIVAPGDTLWAIAATRLGDPDWWPVIYLESRPDLSRRNPDLIGSGITLRIPVLAGNVNSPSASDLRLKINAYKIVADDYWIVDNPRASEYAAVAARGFKE